MSYIPPAYTDVGGSITTGYVPPAFTDVGGDVDPPPPYVFQNNGELRMFPLEIADITYTMRNFLNSAYTEGVPGSANSIVRHLAIARQASSVSELYPVLGTHTITVSQHRAIGPGEYFKATSVDGGEFYGKAIEYNPYSGIFTFKIETIASFLPSSNWTFEFRAIVDIPFSGAVNALSNKLTGTVSQDLVLEALQLHNIKSPWVIFEDFGGPFFTLQGALRLVGTGTATINGSEAELAVTDPSTKAHLCYGDSGYFAISAVGLCVFEARVKMPTALSDAGSNYHINVGLQGDASTDDAPFSLGGMGFYYNHAANSGNWVCYTSNSVTPDTDNTSVAAVADTYATFKITVASGTVSYYIDGVLVASSTNVPVDDPDNLMKILAGIRADAALATGRTLVADYLYLEIFGE